MVTTGELNPGARLIQRELMEKFGTSNIPVIEAIRRLEQEGLIATRPNAGAFIPQWTKEDIEGAYLMREALEGLACRLFVGNATQSERDLLVQCHEEFRSCIRKRDPQGWLDADIALHAHVVSVTRSRPFMRCAENSHVIALSIQNAHQLRDQPGKLMPPPIDTHTPLVESLLGDDPQVAERAGRAHVRDAIERMKLWKMFKSAGMEEAADELLGQGE